MAKIHMSRKEREEQIKAFVSICLASLEGTGTAQIANDSGLCLSTIYRLREGKASLRTWIGTVQGLGLAAGLRLEMTKYKATIKLARRPRRKAG